VVNLLLAKGANVNARDDQKRTPLVRAEQWHQDAVVQLLRQHGGTE
jgi:ankyrin repeat protein